MADRHPSPGLSNQVALGAVLCGALLLAGAACGGTSTAPESSRPTEKATNDGAAPTPAAQLPPVVAEFQDLATKWRQREARIVYEYTSPGAPDSTATLYWKPDQGWRWDLSAPGETTLTWVNQSGELYSCSQSLECTQVSMLVARGLAAVASFDDQRSVDVLVQGPELLWERSERTIADRVATCFSMTVAVDSEGPNQTVAMCFDDEGFLLYGEFPGVADTIDTLTATIVDEEVLDSDLALPYPVADPLAP